MEINYVKKTEYFYTFFDNNFVYVISWKYKNNQTLVIKREECNGMMNSLYCDVLIEKKIGDEYILYKEYTISKFEILGDSFNYTRKDLSLAGGERIVLSLQPMKYRIKCVTPFDKQNGYLNKKHDWISDYVYVDFTHDSIVTIVINPKIDEFGYSGGWELSRRKF